MRYEFVSKKMNKIVLIVLGIKLLMGRVFIIVILCLIVLIDIDLKEVNKNFYL